MIYNGLDASKLSDEQLWEKITELQGKISYCYAFSSHLEQIDQMQAIVDALQFEQEERMKRKMIEMELKKSPAVIESDPEARKQEEKPDSDSTTTEKTKKKGGSSLLKQARSSKPSSNTDL